MRNFLLHNITLLLITTSLHAQVINIGSRLELFVDDYLIDEMNNAELKLHHPRRESPAFHFDKPWEGGLCGYVTVINDEDLYRMYYRGLPLSSQDPHQLDVTCYAESTDGLQWSKPNLGIHEINGSRNNNVILSGAGSVTHNFSPFLDTNPNTPPSQRFKAVGGNDSSGLIAYSSEDGKHFQLLQKEPIITKGQFDSQNIIFWSTLEKQYICYFRTWINIGDTGYRSVSRATSPDFIHWSDPIEMDFGNTPREHIYTNQTGPYFRAPHIYISTAARFMPNKQALTNDQIAELKLNDPENYRNITSGCSDGVLMTSRGGNQYTRTFMEAFIRPGADPHDWTARTNYPALNVVAKDEKTMLLYVQRHYGQPNAYLETLSMRTDGFASLHAGYDNGEMITKALMFSGTTLILNYETSAAGSIAVELLDQNKKPIPGYTIEDCDLIAGNKINRTITWDNKFDLSSITNKPIHLRVVLQDADLYSIQFKE